MPQGDIRLPGLLAGWALACAAAGPVAATTLQQAVQAGLAQDPQVRAAAAGAERARAEVDVARNGHYPVLTADTGPTRDGRLTYTVSVSQKLYDWGRTDRRIDAAVATAKVEDEALERTRDDVALSIGNLHVDLLDLNARMAAVQAQVQWLDALLSVSRQRVAGGYSDAGESGRVAAERSRLNDQLTSLRSQAQSAGVQFTELTGLPPIALEAPAVPESFTQNRFLAGLDTLVRNAPIVRQAQADAQAQAARLREAELSMRPQLALQGGRIRSQVGGQIYNDTNIGLRLTIEPIQGWAAQDRSRVERLRLEGALAKQSNVSRELRRKALSLIESAVALRSREPVLRVRVEQLLALSQIYETQFLAGRRAFNELLTVGVERFDAERQLAEVKAQSMRVPLELAARLGLLLPWLQGRQDMIGAADE